MNKAVGLSHNDRGCLGSGLEFIIQFKCEGISLVGYWELSRGTVNTSVVTTKFSSGTWRN